MYAEHLRPEERSILAAWTLPPPKRKPLLAAAEPEIEKLIVAGYISRFPGNGALYLADSGKLVLGAAMRARLEELVAVMRARGEELPAANEPSHPTSKRSKAALPCPDCEAGAGEAHASGCSIDPAGPELARLRSRIRELEAENTLLRAQPPKAARRPASSTADPLATPAKALAAWHAAGGDGAPRIPIWRETVEKDFKNLSPAAFRAAMATRIDGTRELAERRRAFIAEAARRIGSGSGEHLYNPATRQYELCAGTGPERDAVEARIRAALTDDRRRDVLARRRVAQRARAERRAAGRKAERSALDQEQHRHRARFPFGPRGDLEHRVRSAVEESRKAREASRIGSSRFGWTEEDFDQGGVTLS